MGIRISELAAAASLSGAEQFELSQSSSVTIAATTISASASDNSFNDSASGFVTAGFAVGNSVRVLGFTGNVANNLFSGRITSLTAGKMIIGGTDGDAIVDESAGASVTITKWESRRVALEDLGPSIAATGLQDLQFSRVQTVALADLVPAAGVIVNEPFAADTGQFTRKTDSTLFPVFTVSGSLTLQNTSGAARTDMVQTGDSLTLPQFAAEVSVTSRTASTGYDFVEVGLLKDANNFIMVAHENGANQLSIRVKISGSETAYLNLSLSLTAPFKLGISILGNSVCAYTDTGAGWTYRGQQDISAKIQMRTANLAGWKTAVLSAAGNNCTHVYDNLKSGLLGGFGWRDFTIVTNEDGTPYINSGLAYFTAACNDGFGEGYQGLWSIDLSTYACTYISAIMMTRAGSVYNDGALHLIRYSDTSWKCLWTTWGNGFGNAIDTWYAATTDPYLTPGAYTITGGTKLTLPYQNAGHAAYDAMLRKDGSTWKLAYTVSTSTSFTGNPFYPAVASSTDLATWTGVATNPSDRPFEGSKWVKAGGAFYITSGGVFTVRCYDEQLNFRGLLQATTDGGTVTYPHAMIFWTGSKHLMLTWNQNRPAVSPSVGLWGEMVIHEAP